MWLTKCYDSKRHRARALEWVRPSPSAKCSRNILRFILILRNLKRQETSVFTDLDFEITLSLFPVNTKYSSKCSRVKVFRNSWNIPHEYKLLNSFGHGISLKHYQLISSPYIETLCYLQSTASYIKPACYLQTTLTPLHIKAAYFLQFTALYKVQMSVYLWSTSNPHRIRS